MSLYVFLLFSLSYFSHLGSWYMYMDGSKWRFDSQAVLLSPYVMNPPDRTECYFLSFWYSMVGTDVGSLSVLLYSKKTRMKEALWHQDGQRGNKWNQGGVQFTQAGHFRVRNLRYIRKSLLGKDCGCNLTNFGLSSTIKEFT